LHNFDGHLEGEQQLVALKQTLGKKLQNKDEQWFATLKGEATYFEWAIP